MKKKKKKSAKPAKPVDTNEFSPDPLVEGDRSSFDKTRIFCVKDSTISYTFREHYLFFSWENKYSKNYAPTCPPASYHLERRSDLRNFCFFTFRKDHKRVRMYRYALEKHMCSDLLEYISENLEELTYNTFRQSIEELRQSKLLVKSEPDPPLKDDIKIDPLFKVRKPLCSTYKLLFGKSAPSGNTQVDEFSKWFNTLNDPIVNEWPSFDPKIKLSVDLSPEIKFEEKYDVLNSVDYLMRYESTRDSPCVTGLIGKLISKYFNRYATKFKFAICASPGFGKTRLMSIFRQFLMVDLDDISMLDPIEGKLFHKLVDNREWGKQKLEYFRVIRTKFKEGIILCQNSDQVPPEIPYVNVITPGHLGRKKLWSDRGLYDLVIKNNFKIFVHDKLTRNSLVEIIYSEIYNSYNYHLDS